MRWVFLLAGIASMILFYGVGPQLAMPVAFVVLSINFTTFCLQYDDPINRARKRVNAALGQLTPGGIHAQEYQRLQSAAPVISSEDREIRYGPMTITSIISGIASIGLLIWGITLRTM
jgi:hypothetical protein